jgi:hypothetical protein
MRNLVMGLYDGYDSLETPKGGLRIFVESFRNYNADDRMVVFVQTRYVFPAMSELARRHRVELCDYDEIVAKQWNQDRQTYRLLLYHRWLASCDEEFGKILLSDTNDVIFFGNPFDIETSGVYCALEKSTYSDSASENMSSVTCNVGWLNVVGWPVRVSRLRPGAACNPHERRIRGNHVVCSGTVFGLADHIRRYLAHTVAHPFRTYTGADQGCWNKYVYSQPPGAFDMVPYARSRILTLDSIDHATIPKDSDGFYLNEHGERYLILHQIDRGCQIDHFRGLHARCHART